MYIDNTHPTQNLTLFSRIVGKDAHSSRFRNIRDTSSLNYMNFLAKRRNTGFHIVCSPAQKDAFDRRYLIKES